MEIDLLANEETGQRSCLIPSVATRDAHKPEESAARFLQKKQRQIEEQRSLLEELARIEQDLKESIRREEKRQQELDQVRREENRIHWGSLTFLSLNQRTAKPWVTSYYKNIPMHIYCLPIDTVVRKQNTKKTKR
ncbi:hypothetical protein DNTS_007831 [Danionella cerebrum]|uniref:Uncharacterized protein n=1 Tax=Danionella cerebrum TaxID=2873325 RepID=A0A553RG04_9TELE|nr:hypothetical protein DNTS_007831 [Danionella translucida]